MSSSNWTAKGGAFSDKSTREEYGLSQAEIHDGIRNGDLQYQRKHIHGNPYLCLLSDEVEELVKTLHGDGFSGRTETADGTENRRARGSYLQVEAEEAGKAEDQLSGELEEMQAVV